MRRIDYFRVFGFLAFMGSAFLSTIFHYPVFTVTWFIIMIVFVLALTAETDEMTILTFVTLAYAPLGLISLLSNYIDKNHSDKLVFSLIGISNFAFLLCVFVIIEGILAISWCAVNNESNSKL